MRLWPIIYIYIVYIRKLMWKKVRLCDPINMRELDAHCFTISNLSTVARVGIADETGIVIVDITRSCNLYLKHDQSDYFHLNIIVGYRCTYHERAKECCEYWDHKNHFNLSSSNLILADFRFQKEKQLFRSFNFICNDLANLFLPAE